jgi:hypothetical protein
MKNSVYYIKPTNNDFPEAIKDGLIKAFALISKKGYSNIKFVLSSESLLDNPPNYISQALDKFFTNQGDNLTKQLKKQRGISISKFPTDNQTTGIKVLLANNNPTFLDNDTVVVLLWADFDSFKKIQSSLFWTQIDLVAIAFNDTSNLNELLSSSKAINISSTADPNVVPYQNNFPQNTKDILDRLKSINITDRASHKPTRERMKSVIDELDKNSITVSYVDFLGFLVNDVNFKLEDSVDLLNWKHNYFGR